jgi:hypothetical protein
MNRPPCYPPASPPTPPRWRRWGAALIALYGVQGAAWVAVAPALDAPALRWWGSAVLFLGWALALAVRVLPWRLELFYQGVYQQAQAARLHGWWRQRSLALPVRQVLLLGPSGSTQEHYRHLQAQVPAPRPVNLAQPALLCPLGMAHDGARGPALAQHLAQMTLALPRLAEQWPRLKGLVWVGDTNLQATFVEALCIEGLVAPRVSASMRTLDDLDRVIDAFHSDCQADEDWLLCAGVASLDAGAGTGPPGEAGFVWIAGRLGEQCLHRGDYLNTEAQEDSATLCAQVQRYAGLTAAPQCLALDLASQGAFVAGGWQAAEHQLGKHWRALGELAPFIGMSLALLQAGHSRQACGWLGQDAEQRLAIGVAMPHGD